MKPIVTLLRQSFAVWMAVAVGLGAAVVGAQELPRLNLAEQLTPGLGPAGPGGGDHVFFAGQFQLEQDSRRGTLSVTAKVDPDWHVYSTTQPAGGPTRSSLTIKDSDQFTLLGEFTADRDPEVHYYREIWGDIPVEEHSGEVVWSAPIELAEGVDPDSLRIELLYNGQVCQNDGVCIPLFDVAIEAAFAGYQQAQPEATGEFRPATANAVIRGHFEPKVAVAGQPLRLTVTVVPDDEWHIYPLAEKDVAGAGNKPTLLAFSRTFGWTASAPVATAEPVSKQVAPGEPPQQYYDQQVSWTVDFQVPADVKPGQYALKGVLGLQTCKDITCLPPTGVQFQATVTVAASQQAGQQPLAFADSSYSEAAKLAAAQASRSEQASGDDEPLDLSTLGMVILFSLCGGFILNLMPCVLPVIGLKILSFAEQAGKSRARILSLNLWFAGGLLLVFLVLATLAAFLNLGWGEQFTLTWFKVAMTVLVFAMALSFLGVWEIPIPGFMGTGKTNELQAREGAGGAFFKGMFTTILATPCSGPFLGPVFGYTLSQPPYVTYIIFTSVGLGMASPYLVIGAFPNLIRFLPKPGAWMETFKQLMGFVLLATVVYLFTTIKTDYFIATLTLLVGVWFACWWIGRTPLTAELPTKTFTWTGATAVAVLTGYMSFSWLVPHQELLPWQPFSPQALAQAQASGKTVMVDFTADWCLTCKFNLKTAIDTRRVQEIVKKNDVVPMLADWTDKSQTIKDALKKLDAKSIPLLAIYPAGRPGEVIVLRDLLVESQVIEALQRAGPSQGSSVAQKTVMK